MLAFHTSFSLIVNLFTSDQCVTSIMFTVVVSLVFGDEFMLLCGWLFWNTKQNHYDYSSTQKPEHNDCPWTQAIYFLFKPFD